MTDTMAHGMHRRPRLFLVVDDMGWGGTGRQVFDLIKGLAGSGRYDISIYYFREVDFVSTAELPAGVRLRCFPQSGKLDLRCIARLTREFRNERPDIVHTFLFTSDTYGRIAAVLSGTPIIVSSVRNVDLWKNSSHVFVDRALAPFTARFLANAQAVKRFLVERERIAPERIGVIYNGIDPERLRVTGAREEALWSLGLPPDKKVVLNISRFSTQKDYPTFLKAAASVKNSFEGVHFLVAGRGEREEAVRREVARIGLEGTVTIMAKRHDVPEMLAASDICSFAPVYEGCSNFVMESMAAGKPVVATDAGGNRELIVDGKTGYVVPVRDADALAERIVRLLKDPGLAQRMGAAGKGRMERDFPVQKMVDETLAVYESLLAARRSR